MRLLLVTAVGGCSSGVSGPDGASTASTASSVPAVLPAVPTGDESPDAPASDLAPSQRTGSTVPAPATPVLCQLDDLTIWTAHLVANPTSIDAVIRVRNAGDVRCDADIGRTPNLDPAAEFDVWLEPGQTADLVIGQEPTDCRDPQFVSEVEIAIDDDLAVVPTAIVSCAWWLTAFVPNDPVLVGCERDSLQLAVHPNALLVRNRSASPCSLAAITEVEGAMTTDELSPGPVVSALMSGDVVAFGRRAATCDGAPGRVVLLDELGRGLAVDDVPCELVFELGGGRPWFGADAVPLDDLRNVSPAAVFESLNPFDVTE